MVRLNWDNEESPMYQTGVSHGVFYGDDGVGYAWSGLISVTEKPQANAPTSVYNAMGQKYDIFGNEAEKKHGLACYIYPEVMDEYLGYEYLEEFGFIADERPPKKFHMAYRVELGDGLYEIHVLLNQIATFGETARQTISNIMAPSTITMNLEGAVDPRFGTSHLVLDSRAPFTKSAEALLFGDQNNEANIHSFLTAEPVWETVATNYAPIIEPDYDNYVWLGWENLYEVYDDSVFYEKIRNNKSELILTKGVDSLGWYLDGSAKDDSSIWNINTYYLDTYGNGSLSNIPNNTDPLSVSFDVRLNHDSILESSNSFIDPPEILKANTWYRLYRKPTTTVSRPGGVALSRVDGAVKETLRLRIRNYKIERGTIHTPWTPAPSDPNQTPRSSDPHPDNYKPAIKNSSEWVSDNGPLQVFYDEDHKGLGLYSKSTFESLNTYSDVYWDDKTPHISINTIPRNILGGRSVYASAKVNMTNPIPYLMSLRYATIGVGQNGPVAESPPNTRGDSDLYVLNNRLSVPTGSAYDSIRLYHGGSSGTETLTFKDILIAPLNQEPKFFDVNSKPPSKGVRYQRVSTPNGDYTIEQELHLRIK